MNKGAMNGLRSLKNTFITHKALTIKSLPLTLSFGRRNKYLKDNSWRQQTLLI